MSCQKSGSSGTEKLTLADLLSKDVTYFLKVWPRAFLNYIGKGNAQGEGKGYLFVQQENRYKYIFFVGGGESKNLLIQITSMEMLGHLKAKLFFLNFTTFKCSY